MAVGTNSLFGRMGADNTSTSVPSYTPKQPRKNSVPTQREVYAKAYELKKTDPERATQFLLDYERFSRDKTTPLYRYYSQPTNQAMDNLKELGFDTDYLTNGWLDTDEANTYIQSNLEHRSGSGNSVSAPTKKSTWDNKVAYELNQYKIANVFTQQAKQEYADIINEVAFLAGNNTWNYSDDDIIDRVIGVDADGNIDYHALKKKYPALYDMMDGAAKNNPKELNEALDFSVDTVYGAAWAARNPDYDGNIRGAMANSWLGTGNTWQENKEITNLLSPMINGEINDDYQPYAVGSTVAYDDALFFDRYGFDDAFIEENKHLKYDGTDEEKKHYANVETAVNNYHAAKDAAEAVYGYTNYLIGKGAKDAKEVQDALDVVFATGKLYVGTDKDGNKKYYTKAGKGREEINLDILNKMDASMGKNRGKENATEPDPSKIVPLGIGINYKYDNLIKQIETAYDKMNAIKDSVDTVASLDPDYDEEAGREKKPFELIAENKKRNASKSMGILEDRFSEFESRNFDASPTPNGTELADSFYEAKQSAMGTSEKFGGPYDTAKLSDPEWVAKMATKQAEKADANYLQVSMDSLEVRTKYEALEKETEQLVAQLDQIESTYGDVLLARQNMSDTMILTGGPNDELEFTFTKGDDGKYHYDSDANSAGAYYLENYYYNNGMTKEDLERDIKEKEQRLNDQNEIVQNAKERVANASQVFTLEDDEGNSLDVPLVFDKEVGAYVISPEFNSESPSVDEYLEKTGETREQLFNEIKNYTRTLNEDIPTAFEDDPNVPTEEEIKRLRTQIDVNTNELKNGKEAYDKAVADVKKASDRRNRVNDVTLRNSGMYVDPRIADSTLSYVSSFTDWTKPADGYRTEDGEYISFMSSLRDEFAFNDPTEEDIANVNAYVGELNEEAKDIRFVLEQNPDIPDSYKKKMEQCANWYESRARLYEDFVLSKSEGFDQLVEEGKNKLFNANTLDVSMPGFTLMTDYEQDIFYALYAKKGMEGAKQFYDDIEESLIERQKSYVDAGTKEIAESGFFGRAFNEMISIGSSVVEVPLNVAYLIDSAFNGEGNAWLRMPSYMAKKANEEVISELKDLYKGTVWADIWPSLAEMINNRGRSIVTSYVYGGLIPEIGNTFLNNTVNAFPIATIAFGEAYEDAKARGMDDLQAWTLGLVNFASESMTEGIRFGNYKSLFEGGVTLQSFKDYFINKIKGLDWLEEAVGESLNDIIEKGFDAWIGGDKSVHEERKRAYIESGLVNSEEEAEIMVMADYIKEVGHTAIISALSSFLDVGAFGVKKLGSTLYYANEASKYNKTHTDTVTIRDLRNRDIETFRRAKELQENGEKIRQEAIERARQPFVPVNPANVSEGQQAKNASEYDVDITILENSTDSDKATVTGTISAVLRVSDQNANRANAAAVAFATKYGNDAINALQDMLDAGQKAGTNINTLKLGIQYAMLAEGECNRVMNSEEYQNATPEQQAAMLSEATQIDANDPNSQNSVNTNVRENRIAEEEKKLFGENEAFELNALQENANEAAMKTYVAQQELDDKLQARKAASDNVTSITMDFLADPSDDNAKRKDQAEHELAAADAVVNEYKQHYQNTLDQQTKAENALESTKDEVMTRIRAEAEARVDQMEQQEAEAQVVLEQQEAIAQQQVEQQAAADVQADNAMNADIEAFIEENYPDATEEDKQTIREQFAKIRSETQANPVTVDEQGNLTEEARVNRDKLVNRVSQKFGINFRFADTKAENGFFSNGYYDRANNTIVLDNNATMDDALYFVMGHELLHVAERSETYRALANTLLRTSYGPNADFQTAIDNLIKNNGRPTTTLEADILQIKQRYDSQLGQENSYEYALQELVADQMGTLLNPQDEAQRQELIDRLVKDDPSTARRILDSIKKFLKQMVGMKGAVLTNAQMTVDMLENALKNVQNETETNTEIKNSLPVAQPIAEDDEGNELAVELPGGTVAVNELRFSLSSFTADEQAKVRQALIDSGRFTTDEVDNYLNDALGIASMIAADKERLDFTADPTKTMLKPNAEYVKTLDASTLCAKRLVYQGTFDEIQHQLPNTPLMPTDLIDLANMMRDMGYEAPCGICYVESRRRNLGKFAQEWLNSYKGEYVPTLDEVTTTDGLEALRTSHPQTYQDFINAMNKKGTMNPKVVQLRTDYRGEIRDMTPGQIQKVKDIGGLRVQSFSDFETPHLLDMVQAVLDMSSAGLTSQAYTKVPNFAWVFGDTGIKINLSLIGAENGVDAEGNLLFDNTEGMNFEEAMRLRDRYSKNVGTILVGMNDAHILAAMADNRIDFIIPFHKSGWSSEELAKMPVLNSYTDYTNSQNEKAIVGRTKDGGYKTESLEKSKRVNFQPVGENGYWDFTKTGKENAEVYLKMCAEDGRLPKFSQFLVDNGDSSFSLQEDGSTDGYWKTLIDFKMYDNDGIGSPQTEVTPNINMEEATRVLNEFDGRGVNGLPVAEPVVERFVSEYKENHPITEGMRYSLPSNDLLAQQIRNYLANGGSVNRIGTSKFVTDTAPRSTILHEKAKAHLIENGEYLKDSNNEQLSRALDWIASHANKTDTSGFYGALSEMQSPAFNPMSPDGQARMVALMAMATSLSNENESVEMQKLISQAYKEQGTNAAQTLQARKLFNLMTPMGRQATLMTLQEKINKEFADKGSNTRVNLSDGVLKAAAEAKTAEEFEEVQKMARKEINDQTPVNWKERLLAFRYFAMLCAPTTHVRNFAGNAMFVPLVATKNKVGAVVELIAQATGQIDKSERTKSLMPIAPKGLRDFARQKAKDQKDLLRGQEKYKDGTKLKQERKIYGTKDDAFSKTVGKGMQKAYDFVGNALEWMDWQFLKGHYRRAMSGLMMARGLTPSDMTGATWNEANAYAIEEARKATYRDASAVAEVLGNLNKLYRGDKNEVQMGLNVLQMIVDARFPFKSTPINIAKRGIEYSPAGIAKLLYDAKHLKQYMDYEKGKLTDLPKTAISPTQFIDKLASGLTGTASAALGFLLARFGIIRCAFDPDDPEDKLAKERGDQAYSIRLGKLGNDAVTLVGRLFDGDYKCEIFDEDVTTSLDWAAPVNMSVFFGAALEEQIDDIDDDGTVFEKTTKAFMDILEPMSELSMMSNVREIFNTDAYSELDPIAQFAVDTVLDYAASFVPNIIPKITNIIDQTTRTSYVPSGDKFPQWTLFNEQMQNKFWFLRQDNIPYRNAYGNTSEHIIPAVIENLLSPAKVTKVKHDVYDELERLLVDTKHDKDVDQSDRAKLVLSSPDKSIKVGKETIPLTDKQYDQIKEERGQLATNLLENLFATSEYQYASDATKVNMIQDVYAYATKVAKYHVDNRVALNDSTHNWIESAYTNGNPIEAVIDSNVSKNRKSYIKTYSTELAKAAEVQDDDNVEMSITYLEQAGATESEIRDGVSDYFRPKYHEAYKKFLKADKAGDYQAAYDAESEMEEIQQNMYDLDIGYGTNTFDNWEKSVRKSIGYTEDGDDDEDEDAVDDSYWLNPNMNP